MGFCLICLLLGWALVLSLIVVPDEYASKNTVTFLVSLYITVTFLFLFTLYLGVSHV